MAMTRTKPDWHVYVKAWTAEECEKRWARNREMADASQAALELKRREFEALMNAAELCAPLSSDKAEKLRRATEPAPPCRFWRFWA